MRDREAINRFVAFSLIGWQNYKGGDMDGFLARGIKLLADCDEAVRLDLRRRFDAAMTLSHRVFEQHAFRKSLASGPTRSPINISLLEVSAVVFAGFAETFDPKRDVTLHNIMVKLVLDETFAKSITYSTDSTQAVNKRFKMLEDIVGGAL